VSLLHIRQHMTASELPNVSLQRRKDLVIISMV